MNRFDNLAHAGTQKSVSKALHTLQSFSDFLRRTFCKHCPANIDEDATVALRTIPCERPVCSMIRDGPTINTELHELINGFLLRLGILSLGDDFLVAKIPPAMLELELGVHAMAICRNQFRNWGYLFHSHEPQDHSDSP